MTIHDAKVIDLATVRSVFGTVTADFVPTVRLAAAPLAQVQRARRPETVAEVRNRLCLPERGQQAARHDWVLFVLDELRDYLDVNKVADAAQVIEEALSRIEGTLLCRDQASGLST